MGLLRPRGVCLTSGAYAILSPSLLSRVKISDNKVANGGDRCRNCHSSTRSRATPLFLRGVTAGTKQQRRGRFRARGVTAGAATAAVCARCKTKKQRSRCRCADERFQHSSHVAHETSRQEQIVFFCGHFSPSRGADHQAAIHA